MAFFLDTIKADIVQDFADRGVLAEVLVGEWNMYKNKASARVILGLGAGISQSIGSQAFRFGPGAEFDTGNGTVARPLWACLQNVNVWITAPCIDNSVPPDDRAEVARANTWALMQSALAAMWHSHGGEFAWGNLQWLNEAQGARTYGAAVQFVAQYPIPVLDDSNDLATGDQVKGSSTIDLQDDPLNIPANAFTDP
jgi:hypothetical protein